MPSVPETQRPYSGCCFAIKHSDTCNKWKEGGLQITSALITIVILGSLLGALIANGVNLGAWNAITAGIPEKFFYLGLTIGISAGLVNIALVAALIRTYNDKQYSQEEVNQFSFGEEIRNNCILNKLDLNQFWQLSHRPGVWAFVFKDANGHPGIYAFKKEGDMVAKIRQLGYEDGEESFHVSPEFTSSYIERNISQEERQTKQKWLDKRIDKDFYLMLNLKALDGQDIFAIKIQKGRTTLTTQYFKTEELRDMARTGYFNHEEIEQGTRELQEEVRLLTPSSFWVCETPITLFKYGRDEEKQDYYCIFQKKQDTEEISYDYYPLYEHAEARANMLKISKHYVDAKAQMHIEQSIKQEAETLLQEKHLELLLTKAGDCWSDQVQVEDQERDVLFTRTAEGKIETSFPPDIEAAKQGLHDMTAQVQAGIEYPKTMVEFLSGINIEDENDEKRVRSIAETRLLPNEYDFWENTTQTAFKVYTCIAADENHEAELRCFSTREALEKSMQGRVNGGIRYRLFRNLVEELIKTLEASSEPCILAIPISGKNATFIFEKRDQVLMARILKREMLENDIENRGLANLNAASEAFKMLRYPYSSILQEIYNHSFTFASNNTYGVMNLYESVICLTWAEKTEGYEGPRFRFVRTEEEAHAYATTNLVPKGITLHKG